MDLYSVILHELGHAHLLKHSIPSTRIMYWQLTAGQTRRVIDSDSGNGGSNVLSVGENELNMGFCPLPIGTGSCATPVFQINDEPSINIYPNPFQSEIYVTFSKKQKISEIKIFDILGRMVFDQKINHSNFTQNIYKIEPDELLPSGSYMVFLYSESGLYTEELIKK